MKKYQGSALMDYMVPTAIVGLVIGLGLYYFISGGSLLKFITASGNLKKGSTAGTYVINPPSNIAGIAPGGLNGSPSDPQVQCSMNQCTIDFGSYVLTGIPQDFGAYVESSASSGGSDLLATILEQIAANANIDQATKKLIMQLANRGHDIGYIEGQVESMAGYCEAAASNCDNDVIVTNVQDLIRGPERTNFDTLLSQINTNLSSQSNQEAINTLAIVNILAGEIQNIANEMNSETMAMQPPVSTTMVIYPHITNPDGSRRTNINSAIICNTGDGQDPGYHCS